MDQSESDSALTDLPLQSLELETQTVGKLTALGIQTVGDVYARTPHELAAAGLVRRELEEVAEAAAMFGVVWSVKEELQAAFIAMPDDVVEAFASSPVDPLGLTAGDIAELAEYFDASRRTRRALSLSKHLRLVRRMALLRAPSTGGAARYYFVAVFDASQLPLTQASEIEPFLAHVGNLVSHVLARLGVRQRSRTVAGCAVQIGLTAKQVPTVRALITAHSRWISDGPVFLGAVPPPYDAIARAGLAALTECR